MTIYTGIEKGYEQWLEVEEEKDEVVSEHGLSEHEEVVFNTKHTVDKNEYEDIENYVLIICSVNPNLTMTKTFGSL